MSSVKCYLLFLDFFFDVVLDHETRRNCGTVMFLPNALKFALVRGPARKSVSLARKKPKITTKNWGFPEKKCLNPRWENGGNPFVATPKVGVLRHHDMRIRQLQSRDLSRHPAAAKLMGCFST